jgi:hypothetical protein
VIRDMAASSDMFTMPHWSALAENDDEEDIEEDDTEGEEGAFLSTRAWLGRHQSAGFAGS